MIIRDQCFDLNHPPLQINYIEPLIPSLVTHYLSLIVNLAPYNNYSKNLDHFDKNMNLFQMLYLLTSFFFIR